MKISIIGFFAAVIGFSSSLSLPKLPGINLNLNNSLNRDAKTKKIDNKILRLVTPATLNIIMHPIVGLVDGYWVSQLGGAVQLAGQGCGDQAFSLAYNLAAFMPLVLTPIVAEYNSKEKRNSIIEFMNCALFFSVIFGISTAVIFSLFSENLIKVFLSVDSKVYGYAVTYLRYRSLAFPFVLVNNVIFSVLRGMMDFNSALLVNVRSQVFNLVADPILMQMYGIKGVAIASTISDIYCTFGYYNLLKKKNLIEFRLVNLFTNLKELLKDGIFVQMKNFCSNIIYFMMNKKILSFDLDGKISATNIIILKVLELFSILYDALKSVSTIIIPNSFFNNLDTKRTSERLITFGAYISIVQSILLLFLNNGIKYFTSDLAVIEQFRKILPYIVAFSSFSGISVIIDGILQGRKKFKLQTFNSVLFLISVLITIPFSQNLSHLWLGITLFSLLRLPINFKFLEKVI